MDLIHFTYMIEGAVGADGPHLHARSITRHCDRCALYKDTQAGNGEFLCKNIAKASTKYLIEGME